MSNRVWVLGATGRTGRAIAAALHGSGVELVLAGRDRDRVQGVADELGGAVTVTVGSLDRVLSQLAGDPPGVVVSTVGPFTRTAALVARACPAGTHYVDLSNELGGVQDVLSLDRQAASRDQVFVAGAGFGVLATESAVLAVCEGRPRPQRVRVDALASLAVEAGHVGAALGATIVEVVAAGGREVRGGRLIHAASGGHRGEVVSPDGDVVVTGAGSNGELIAAWRASDADAVVAASPFAPANPLVRASLPAVSALFRVPAVGRLATRAVARIPMRPAPMARAASWGHARAWWPGGEVHDAWTRTGDAHDFTAAVAVEVTERLLRGEGRPGAHTPGALFGIGLVKAAGGEVLIDPAIPTRRG